jgi:hypothetical protein
MGRKAGDKDRGPRKVGGGRHRGETLSETYQRDPDGYTRFDIVVKNACLPFVERQCQKNNTTVRRFIADLVEQASEKEG